jgi:diacylglycerol kinase family enzyme
MTIPANQTIPAFVNARAGSADDARKALRAGGRFDVREVAPDRLADAVKSAVSEGATRVLVAGGDGSIGTAATVLAGTEMEMAILPGGTLNHFARDHGVPVDAGDAIEVAAAGRIALADVAYVNGHLFLNTSSVGAYVLFVRMRERLERYLGYRIASIVAGFRILAQIRPFHVRLEVDGVSRVYRTPIVFVGVGERELQMPALGSRTPSGRSGLHVLVVRGRGAARLLVIALSAVARGVKTVARTPVLDSFVVDRCTIDLPHHESRVAVDGEIIEMTSPLEYEIAREALRIVVPGGASRAET